MSYAPLVHRLGYVRVACITPTVQACDVTGNVHAIGEAAQQAEARGADVILFPELCITGYTCGDMFRMPDLLQAAEDGLESLRSWSTGRAPLLAVGLPLCIDARIYNVVALVHDGHIVAIVPKTYLPNTAEFYDCRWFTSAREASVTTVTLRGCTIPFGTDIVLVDDMDPAIRIGVEICEDLWAVDPPSNYLARAGAVLILNASASNELVGKARYRSSLVAQQSARTYGIYAYASCGPLESTTDTVFSGHAIIAECGEILQESARLTLGTTTTLADVDVRHCLADRNNGTSFAQVPAATARMVHIRLRLSRKTTIERALHPRPFVPSADTDKRERCSEVMDIQSTALAVRMHRSGSKKLVIGLSGGLDSTLALIACVRACDALNKPHSDVLCITMPGFGTSSRTLGNAYKLAEGFGCEIREISIREAVMQHFKDIGHPADTHSVVYENAQARERTQILMDVANGVGGIVVGTGDLSEIALGWSTYNADHMAMYNVNAGVPKTLVRHVVQWYAETLGASPLRESLEDVLSTPVSPELLPLEGDVQVQHTEDILGPYDVHDFFLYHLIRLHEPLETVAILAMVAFDGVYTPADIVGWLETFVRRFTANQFKRSCMPDGIKVGSVALSPRADWRMPSDASASVWLGRIGALRTLLKQA